MTGWTVLIPTTGQPSVVEAPGRHTGLCAQAAQLIRCRWVEAVQPLALQLLGLRLLVDEEGHVTNQPENPIASHLYGAHLSRLAWPIAGPAVVVKNIETGGVPDLAWLTRDEADELLRRLLALEGAS